MSQGKQIRTPQCQYEIVDCFPSTATRYSQTISVCSVRPAQQVTNPSSLCTHYEIARPMFAVSPNHRTSLSSCFSQPADMQEYGTVNVDGHFIKPSQLISIIPHLSNFLFYFPKLSLPFTFHFCSIFGPHLLSGKPFGLKVKQCMFSSRNQG